MRLVRSCHAAAIDFPARGGMGVRGWCGFGYGYWFSVGAPGGRSR